MVEVKADPKPKPYSLNTFHAQLRIILLSFLGVLSLHM